MIGKELELIKNIDLISEKKIVLFGASSLGRRIYNYLKLVGIDIFCYCDNDKQKWGTSIDGINIFSPAELENWEDKESLVIVISSIYIDEIINQLQKSILWERQIYTYIAVEYAVCFCTGYKKLSRQSKILIEKGYNLWVNDQRKMVENFYSNGGIMRELDSVNPVLVFHPAKVGSSSVYYSLKKCGICSLQLNDLYYNINCTDNFEIKKHIFEHYKANHNIKIISLVREPIARDLSYYFQATITDPEYHVRGRVSNDLVEECKKTLVDYTTDRELIQSKRAYSTYDWMDYIALHGRYGVEFDWFDFELKKLFGIDVYAVPFDKQKGYTIISKDNVSVLVVKMEMLNQIEHVIREFVGVDNFKLINDNLGSEKNYSYMYKELKEKITLSKEYVDFYYNDNEYFNWFYSSDERDIFMKKWESRIER